MPSFNTLYYPYIEFPKDIESPKDDVLANGLLFWDSVGRIVPSGYVPNDHRTVRELIDELGFVKNFRPKLEETEEVSRPFVQLIEENTETLRGRFGGDIRVGDTNHLLASNKMSYNLCHTLLKHGLAVEREHGGGGFVEVAPRLFDVYMTALAKAMTDRRQLTRLADKELTYLASSGESVEQIARILLEDAKLSESTRPSEQIEAGLAFIALETVVPKKGQLDMKKLIQFRKKHRNELTAFQDGIRALVKNNDWLMKTQDEDALKAHLEGLYNTHIKPGQQELKSALRHLGIDTVKGVANIKLEAAPVAAGLGAIGVGGAALGATIGTLALANPVVVSAASVAVVGGVALSLSKVLEDARDKVKAVRKGSTAAYLQDMEETFSPTASLTNMAATVRRMSFGL